MLGIDYATDMNRVINLDKQKMIFKKKSLRVVVSLDPTEGACYTEPVRDDELDCIYQIMAGDQDQVNLTADGKISWERDNSCTSNSDKEVKCWQNHARSDNTKLQHDD